MDTLSLGYLSLPGASAQQLVQAAQAARLRRVGLRIAGRKPADAGDWVLGRAERLRDLRVALVDTATEVLSVAAYYVDEHTTVADFLPVFETAALLGARFVCLSSYDPDEARLAGTLAALAETARDHHLHLALEFVPYSATRTLAAAAHAIALSRASHLGVLLDLLHFMRSASGLASLRALPPEHLAYVQLCDGPLTGPAPEKLAEEARGQRLYPGQGAFPLRDILQALPASVPFEIETPHAGLAGRGFDEQAIAAAAATRHFLGQFNNNQEQTA